MGLKDPYQPKSKQQRRKDSGRQHRDDYPSPRVARKPDLDACPPGWDEDVWHLALYFRQVAQSTTRRETRNAKIRLEHGLPLIYAHLERACEPFREWFSRRQEKISSGRNIRPVFVGNSKKSVRPAENWVEVVERAIDWHFRQYYEDEYAAETFCQPGMFRDMIRESRENAYNWWLLKRRDERSEEE